MAGIAHNPHDKLFKDTFAHKESLLGFMRAYLPDNITTLISETSIEPYTGTPTPEHARTDDGFAFTQVPRQTLE